MLALKRKRKHLANVYSESVQCFAEMGVDAKNLERPQRSYRMSKPLSYEGDATSLPSPLRDFPGI